MSELIKVHCIICYDEEFFDEENVPSNYICEYCAKKDKETDIW